MADGIIAVLLERLVSTVYEYVDGEMKHVLNVAKEIDDFAAKLKGIQAVLEDAEQRQVKDASVRIWLDKLNDISYKMVDVLDEWNTDILKQQVEHQEREGEKVAPKKKMKKKVAFSISPSCFCFRKAREVTFRHEIASKIKDLNDKLSVIDEQRRNTLVFQLNQNGIQQVPKRQETSHYVDMSTVFGRENEKDVLITKLLSDGREDRRGILTIPILGMGGMGKTTLTQLAYNDANVQTYFDKRIWVCVSHPFDEIKIAKAISSDNPPSSNDQLSHVLDSMSTSIKGKRFLIVLDDVWTHDPEKWELLRIPLIQSGAKGSRILVTTRQHDVVDKMEATRDVINLEELSEKYCLSIFDHFSGRQVDEFEDISKEMVEKCKGLPLAAKALGSLMRNKRTRRAWLDVLNSKIDCLINHWRAQDYLNSVGCKMHDIVHDFVQSLTKNECLIIDTASVGNEIEVLGEKVRHLTLKSKHGEPLSPSNAYYNYKNLRTLTIKFSFLRSLEKLPDNIWKLISLKHLYVRGCLELEYLPKGIRRLKKLKTIDECVVVCGDDEDRAALQVGDLRALNLHGSLTIRLNGNVEDERELEKAQLWHMKQLFYLGINFEHVQYKQTASTKEILNVLRPHENLESLDICYHSSTTCPNWMMSSHNLRFITLLGWTECKFLPPLGKLPYLEKLTIISLRRVEKLSGEFLGIDKAGTSLASSFFPKLKQLVINCMPALVEWEVGVEGWTKEASEISIMPCLSSLEISLCPLLKTLPNFLCKTPLQDLIIKDCLRLFKRCKQGSGEEWPKISHIPNIKISPSWTISKRC
ncbi:unnamed protein product [Malus baccata var. baccata]